MQFCSVLFSFTISLRSGSYIHRNIFSSCIRAQFGGGGQLPSSIPPRYLHNGQLVGDCTSI